MKFSKKFQFMAICLGLTGGFCGVCTGMDGEFTPLDIQDIKGQLPNEPIPEYITDEGAPFVLFHSGDKTIFTKKLGDLYYSDINYNVDSQPIFVSSKQVHDDVYGVTFYVVPTRGDFVREDGTIVGNSIVGPTTYQYFFYQISPAKTAASIALDCLTRIESVPEITADWRDGDLPTAFNVISGIPGAILNSLVQGECS